MIAYWLVRSVCVTFYAHIYVGTVGMTNTNQITAVAQLQLLQSCMSQAVFELCIGRRAGVLSIRLPISYVLQEAKRSLASFEVLAATRVEDASNLAMETARDPSKHRWTATMPHAAGCQWTCFLSYTFLLSL